MEGQLEEGQLCCTEGGSRGLYWRGFRCVVLEGIQVCCHL